LTYYLNRAGAPNETLKITVSDGAGKTVRELSGPKTAGLNRTHWDLRGASPVPPPPAPAPSFSPRGSWVAPGTYTVTVSLGAATASKTVRVEEDPRLQVSEADRKAWADAVEAAGALLARATRAGEAAVSLRRKADELAEELGKNPAAPEPLKKAARDLAEKLAALGTRLRGNPGGPLGFAGAPLTSEPTPLLRDARGIYLALNSITAPPAPQQRELLARTQKGVEEAVAALNAVIAQDVPALNKLVYESGIGRLDPGKPIP
jgi:hypothetical protein